MCTKQRSLMISRSTLERIHKSMLLNHLIMMLRKITRRYHCERLMLFQTKIFTSMITITKRIKSKKLVRKGLPKDEAKLIHGMVVKSNKKLKLCQRKFHLVSIQVNLNLMVRFMLKIRIQTRNSKIKKSVRK